MVFIFISSHIGRYQCGEIKGQDQVASFLLSGFYLKEKKKKRKGGKKRKKNKWKLQDFPSEVQKRRSMQ